jgi:hypothetical protein
MSTRRPGATDGKEPHFPEAVAQWRLALRTELKSASSLPTTLFHTRDAMLEAYLAEATESMLARLHEPAPAVKEPEQPGEKRMEIVTPDELRALPARLRSAGDAVVGLDDHLPAENLAVLADACCSGHEAAAAGAAALLRRLFAIEPEPDPQAAASQLLGCLQQAIVGLPGAEATLTALCQRIVAAIAAHQVDGQRREPDA